MTSNDFTHLFQAFTAAPGFHGTVVRGGAPRVVVGAEVVDAVDVVDEHAVSATTAPSDRSIRRGNRHDIPLRTVNDARRKIRDTQNAAE